METNLKISNKNEFTSCPFWIIIDPKQNFTVDEDGIHRIAGMITGIWFSREAAQIFLDRTRYNFSKNAKVYCHSGVYSDDWAELSEQLTEK